MVSGSVLLDQNRIPLIKRQFVGHDMQLQQLSYEKSWENGVLLWWGNQAHFVSPHKENHDKGQALRD